MDRERKWMLGIVLLATAIAFHLPLLAVWIVILSGLAIGAALSLMVLRRDELLGPVFRPKQGDLAWGFGSAAVLVFAIGYLFNLAIAPVDVASGLLRRCTLKGAFVAEPGSGWWRAVKEYIRDETCRSYAVSLGLTGPVRGVAVVVAAVLEEIAWRAGIQQWFAEKYGTERGWWYAAGLYALAHVPSGRPLLVLLALVGGLVWGGLYRAHGRLVAPVLSHTVFGWMMFHANPLMGFGG